MVAVQAEGPYVPLGPREPSDPGQARSHAVDNTLLVLGVQKGLVTRGREETGTWWVLRWPSWTSWHRTQGQQLCLPCRCASSVLPKARTQCRRLRPPKELRPGQAVGNLFSCPLPIHTAPLKMWSWLASPQGPLSVAQIPLEERKEGHLEDARIYLVPKLILCVGGGGELDRLRL